MPLPNRIREIREDRGLSQQALADAVGTTKGQIDKLEKGHRRLSDDWMRRLARALQCTPIDLHPLTDLTPKTAAMLQLFAALSDQEQDQLIRIASALAEPADGTEHVEVGTSSEKKRKAVRR